MSTTKTVSATASTTTSGGMPITPHVSVKIRTETTLSTYATAGKEPRQTMTPCLATAGANGKTMTILKTATAMTVFPTGKVTTEAPPATTEKFTLLVISELSPDFFKMAF